MKRIRTNLNRNWTFVKEDAAEFAFRLPNSNARCVHLPHDWAVDYPLERENPTGGGGGFCESGIAWYHHVLNMEQLSADHVYYLQFDGIMGDSTIYVNGKKVGENGYGYHSFFCPLTDVLQQGENLIAVRVDNSRQPNSRWYTGSGINRNVYLMECPQVHMAHWGVFFYTNRLFPENASAALQIRSRIVNESDVTVQTGVVHRLYDQDGNLVSRSGTALQLRPGQESEVMTAPVLRGAHLWTPEDPYLYRLVSTVVLQEEALEETELLVGIRTTEFDPEQGFLLNGRSVKLNGMCLHEDTGLTGTAGFREMWAYRLRLLKDMGCNAVRFAHNPPNPMELDLCDELGIMVMDEAFDEWMLTKDKIHNYYSEQFAYGSSQYFKASGEAILRTMLRRDRNHPSIVIWSIGNEILEQSSLDGAKTAAFLTEICHQEDPSRKVTAACDNIESAPPSTAREEFLEALDVVGYNYVGRWRERAELFYETDHHLHPKRCLIGTENPSVGGTRGEYDHSNFWGRDFITASLRHELMYRFTVSRPYVAGDFLWTGIDYLGESSWPSRGSESGPIDTAGFPKDSYYYFRSLWNHDEPTLHILPHWNWEGQEGQFKTVLVYTNCEEVELFLNGRKIAVRGTAVPFVGAEKAWYEDIQGHPTTTDLHLTFDVPYEPGELKAIGYRYVPRPLGPEATDRERYLAKDRVVIAEEVVRTSGPAFSLEAETVNSQVKVNDLALIRLRILDAAGNLVPDADPEIEALVIPQGEARASLQGMDAGNLRDLTPFGLDKRKAFHGCLLCAVRAENAGAVRVLFRSKGFKDAEASFEIR